MRRWRPASRSQCGSAARSISVSASLISQKPLLYKALHHPHIQSHREQLSYRRLARKIDIYDEGAESDAVSFLRLRRTLRMMESLPHDTERKAFIKSERLILFFRGIRTYFDAVVELLL